MKSKRDVHETSLLLFTRFFGRRAVYWGDTQPRYEKSLLGE